MLVAKRWMASINTVNIGNIAINYILEDWDRRIIIKII